jgi:sugar O-acyltransferase (sialic acid O-acetyltransferase NeuD family)
VILGASGTCLDILDTVLELEDAGVGPRYHCIGFLDDDPEKQGLEFMGRKVLGPLTSAADYGDAWFVSGIGSPGDYWKKPQIIARAGVPDGRWATLVHPTASVSRTATVRPGSVLLQHVTVGTNVQIGHHVVVLPNTVVSHDARIGDFTCIAGAACISGGVTIGDSCYVGANASVRERVRIGRHALVGMGSAVLHDVPPRTVVVGSPARAIRQSY